MSGASYTGWAIVEINGYRKLVGLVSEVTMLGVAMLRVEVLGESFDGPRHVHHYPPSSLFGLREISEEQARKEIAPPAWQVWQLPAAPVDTDLGDDPPDSTAERIGNAVIERHAGLAGWALTACGGGEGDAVELVAFCTGGEEDVERLRVELLREALSGASDRFAACTFAALPAFLAADGGVHTAEADRQEDAVAALASRFRVVPAAWSADGDPAASEGEG